MVHVYAYTNKLMKRSENDCALTSLFLCIINANDKLQLEIISIDIVSPFEIDYPIRFAETSFHSTVHSGIIMIMRSFSGEEDYLIS